MSITSELRLVAADPYTGWVPTDKQQADLRAMADRIDAEHEAACAAAYGNGVESVALPDMTAYVKLPLDADGVPIHVGDVMEADNGTTFEVEHISLYPWGWRCDGEGKDRSGVTCTAHAIPDGCRHHHAPTVEDLLREYALKCEEAGNSGPEVKRLATEYAARLMLAGEE